MKSCISTRAGRKAISFSVLEPTEETRARISSAETEALSSCRSRFSSMTFREKGSRDTPLMPDFSRALKRKVPKGFPAQFECGSVNQSYLHRRDVSPPGKIGVSKPPL